MANILVVFIILKLVRQIAESFLATLNRRYFLSKDRQREVCSQLEISSDEFAKTLAYTNDKYFFSQASAWLGLVVFLIFLLLGGFGALENIAVTLCQAQGEILTGLVFFGLLGAVSFIFGLPFELFFTFKIEDKHGFNRQTIKGFITDKIKMLLLASVLGGVLLTGVLYAMQLGAMWWLWAWVMMSLFSVFAAWIYPTLLAPLFNKFTPIADGELKDAIFALAHRLNFKTSGIFIMDASKRSSHGNAYFTGMFGEKRIVLFDTLVQDMTPKQVVAVLAHELGHFKLNHVRWSLIRGIAFTGMLFYALSLCLPLTEFYTAFHFNGVSNYAALVVFSLWFGIIDFFINPLGTWLSRRNEFAADAFAIAHIENPNELTTALKKLSATNRSMPITHPWYSTVYYSHPPLIERIRALNHGSSLRDKSR